MNRRFVILAGLALLAGCATAPPPIVAHAASALGELEPLYSASAGAKGLTIRVASSGCTKREDFAFFVEKKGQAVTLAFGRKRLDPCKSFAMGHTDLIFPYEELGVTRETPLFVLNPFYPWTGPGA
jgi:hypothetical protein